MLSPILIVGEFFSEEDEQQGRPFQGSDGYVVRGLMAQAGIEEDAVHKTVVFPFRPPSGKIDSLLTKVRAESVQGWGAFTRGNYLHSKWQIHLTKLWQLIDQVQPNVILALGNVALWATTGRTGMEKHRGSPLPSIREDYKIIATWAPGSINRQWELRPVVFMDFCKALKQSETRRLIRPSRVIQIEPTLRDIADYYEKKIVPARYLSVDIETKAGQITEIGFAPSARSALVIPFWGRTRPNYWPTLLEELEAWNWVRRILLEKEVFGQNFQYDMGYLYKYYGITCPRFIGDTMLATHSLQPEMKKSLGFLGSIYTDEPSWKFMRSDHTTLKQGDD